MSLSILDVEPEGPSYDLTGIVTHECMCGSNLWHIVATFEDYDIAMYFEDMQCVACGTRAQAPCPLDDPSHAA